MRTFIELELPAEIREALKDRQDAVRTALERHGLAPCLRWSASANVHLTLRFLGETTREQAEAVGRGLDEIAGAHRAMSLRLGEFGCFPSPQRPRVLWFGVDGEMEALQSLQQDVEALVRRCWFDADARPYSPHLTIARVKRECSGENQRRLADSFLELMSEAESIEHGTPNRYCFMAECLVHMRSDLRPSGPLYTPLTARHLIG